VTDDLGLLTTKEAAELLRLSPTAVRNLRLAGKLPFVKLGRKIFFKKSALIEFVDNQQLIYPTQGDQ
jgi:excisionase family DNA binding protein